MKKQSNILLFGSFDNFHPGHEFIINYAKKYSSKIVIVVAQDATITKFKNRPPIHTLEKRIENIRQKYPCIHIEHGDIVPGTWSAIKKHRPNKVIVGYDQQSLRQALEGIQSLYEFTIIQAPSFHPEKYKSSILRKKKNL